MLWPDISQIWYLWHRLRYCQSIPEFILVGCDIVSLSNICLHQTYHTTGRPWILVENEFYLELKYFLIFLKGPKRDTFNPLILWHDWKGIGLLTQKILMFRKNFLHNIPGRNGGPVKCDLRSPGTFEDNENHQSIFDPGFSVKKDSIPWAGCDYLVVIDCLFSENVFKENSRSQSHY